MTKSWVWVKALLIVVILFVAAAPAASAASAASAPASQVVQSSTASASIGPKPPAGPMSCTYRVRWGDTLANIAWRYHTSTWQMAAMNRIGNPNRIWAGQVLRVPCTRR